MPNANRVSQEGILRPAEYDEIQASHGRLKSRREKLVREREEHVQSIAAIDLALKALEDAEAVYTTRLGSAVTEYERAHKK